MAVSSQRVALCVGVLLAVVCLPVARALECYQCNSFEDPGCADVTTGNATYAHLLKPCDGDYGGQKPFCRKMVQTLQRKEPIVRVRRTCSWERSRNPCYKYEDDDHLEMVCQCFDDGCNGAAAPPALGLLASLAVSAAVALLRTPL